MKYSEEQIKRIEQLDKRSKEYREYKEYVASLPKGLGDVVEDVAQATGIDKAVKSVFGEDCGCDKRKELLNKWFPLNRPQNCMEEDDFIYLKDFFSRSRTRVSLNEQKALLRIYNHIFGTNQQVSNCGSCVKNIYNTLKTIVDRHNAN